MIEEKRSYRFTGFLPVCLLLGLLFGGVLRAAAALPQTPVPSRITVPVDNAVRVTVARSTHPMAQAQFDRGPVAPDTAMERMILVLRNTPDQDHQLRTLLDSQQTKGSPDYHHWLTPQEIGQRFGPAPQDIQQVTSWLQQQGFSIGSVAKSGRWIEFSGTAAQVNQAFQTQMRTFEVEGKLHTANNTDISIPAALAPVVQGVASLHDFYSKPMLRRSLQHEKPTITPGKMGSGPQITFTDGTHGVGPADFATIYNLNPLYAAGVKGSNQTIAIVGVSNITTSDITTFQTLFGLTSNPPNVILNGPDPGIVPGAVDEATIDVEWSGAVAPQATIDLVVSGGTLTTDPVLLSSLFIVENDLAPIMSVSFGACEQNLQNENVLFALLWQQAAAQGISVFVASGDTGAAGCDPNGGGPNGGNVTIAQRGLGVSGVASTQFNTAVGGTEFNETVNGGTGATFWNPASDPTTHESAITYIPEKVWNDSCVPTEAGSLCQQFNFISLASGSGGISTINPVPSWQTLAITGLQGAGFNSRVLPDISLTAANEHDPLAFCVTDPAEQLSCTDLTTVVFGGGTSFSSPSFAGIMALVDQKLGSRQGLANYVLYPLATTEFASASTLSPCNSSNQTNPAKPNTAFQACIFADTTAGSNGVPGNDVLKIASPGNTVGQLGYNAITGFDLGTGLGSVNANNLVTAWSKVTFQGTTSSLSASVGGNPTTTISITHGQPVSITMNVAAIAGTTPPTGNVSLLAQGGTPAVTSNIGVVGAQLAPGSPAGTATTNAFNVNNLPGGTKYNIVASYPGDGNFGSSTSSPTAITVNVSPEGTTTTLASDIANLNNGTFTAGTTVAYGDPVNLLVIDAAAAGGSGLVPSAGIITFTDIFQGTSTQILQTPVDNSGIGEFVSCGGPPPCLAPGTHLITAGYSGDVNSYLGSTSASVTITVTPGTVLPVISAPTSVNTGVQFTLQVQAQPAGLATITPTGSVQFFDGTTALGSAVTLTAGTASMPVTFNTGGVHSITAQFTPADKNYNGATSAGFAITVAAPFNFTATTSSQTVAAGANATFNITLSSTGGFTGAVNFSCAGATGGATCTVSPNPASLTSTTTSIPLTVTVNNTTNAKLAPRPLRTLPWAFAAAFAGLLFGIKRKPRQALLMVLALALMVGVGSCGGGGNNNPGPKPPTVDSLVVTGTSGSSTSTINLTLTITH